MPDFETPEPISVTITLGVGDVRIIASHRTDTVVAVNPSDAAKPADVQAARETRVEYSEGRLSIRAPKLWKQWTPFGGSESIDVAVELPSGSQVECQAGVAEVRCEGRLGDCAFIIGAGSIRLDDTGHLRLSTGAGSVSVGRVVGRGEITGSGEVRISEIHGPAVIKNLNGVTWVGEVEGDLRCNAANGDIAVDRALGAVKAKTANRAVRIGEVVPGSVERRTS
ncbi:MAG: DUF4097 family beta strand repeat-containing protein [Candidatus Dormibacterales bacterium]